MQLRLTDGPLKTICIQGSIRVLVHKGQVDTVRDSCERLPPKLDGAPTLRQIEHQHGSAAARTVDPLAPTRSPTHHDTSRLFPGRGRYRRASEICVRTANTLPRSSLKEGTLDQMIVLLAGMSFINPHSSLWQMTAQVLDGRLVRESKALL